MRIGEVTFREPVDQVLARLATAEAEDDAAEAKAKKLGCATGLAVVALFGSIFLAAETGFWPAPVIAVLALVGLIVWLVRTKRHDLDDRKLAAAQRFLTILRADLPSGAPVALRLDFRDAKDGGTKVGTTAARVFRFEHRWLDVSVRLADGNDVTISVVSDVLRKEKPKRKYTKVRQRVIEDVECRVRLDGRYADGAAVAERLRVVRPPEPLEPRGVAGDGAALRVRVRTPAHVTVSARSGETALTPDTRVSGDTLLSTVMWIYRGLAPSGSA